MTQNLSSWMRPQFAIDFLPHRKPLSLSPMLNFISAVYLTLFLPTMVAVSGEYFPSFKWVIAPSKDRNGVFSFAAAQGSLLRMVVAHQYQCWLLYDSPKAFFFGSFLPWNTLLCQLDAVNVLSPHAPQLIGWHGHRKMGTPDGHCRPRKRGAAKVDGERHKRTISTGRRELTKGMEGAVKWNCMEKGNFPAFKKCIWIITFMFTPWNLGIALWCAGASEFSL